MFMSGLASQAFMREFKISVGSVNIYFLDLLYSAALILAVFGLLKVLLSGRIFQANRYLKAAVFICLLFFVFFLSKSILGFFSGVSPDTLVRRFAMDTQFVYMFIPLIYLRKEAHLKSLLTFIVLLSLLFPLFQPFLYGGADQVALEAGQGGTLRLGGGYTNLLLMLAVLAFVVWEKKVWLSVLPLAGIAMLAQRSAFLALAICVFVIAIMKRMSVKFFGLLAVIGVGMIAVLFVIQLFFSVPVVSKAAERFSQTFEKTGTTEARIGVIPIAFNEFVHRPIAGLSYRELYDLEQVQHTDAVAFNILHPHNFVLSFLMRTGLVGTLLLFTVISIALLASRSLCRQPTTIKQGQFLFGAILFFVVFGLMNTTFQAAGFIFWTLLGVTLWYQEKLQYSRNASKALNK